MEDRNWDEADAADTAEDINYIKEDIPRVLQIENSLKYRSFTALDDNRSTGSSLDDAAFRIFKRRRFDALDEEVSVEGDTIIKPLLHRLVDPFEITQRQYQTFQWLSTKPTASAIASRFALDRNLGAPPCLGAVNRALRSLCDDQTNEPLCDEILDIIEDVLLDGGDVALSTLTTVIKGLLLQPARCGRLAFTLINALKGTATDVPANLWVELSNNLADSARNAVDGKYEDLMPLFNDVVYLVRLGGLTLNESTIAKFGASILNHHGHIHGAVQLVEDELLSGRNDPDNIPAISSFLSDLLPLTCREVIISHYGKHEGDSGNNPVITDEAFSPSRIIDFAGDVVKYAYARKILLKSTAFDAILELCDLEKNYFRLCVLFTAMCVLSTPTLRSLLRFVEVLSDIPELSSSLENILHGSPSSYLLWFFKKYSDNLCSESSSDWYQDCLLEVLRRVGGLFVVEKQPRLFVDLFFVLEEFFPVPALKTFLYSYYSSLRKQHYEDNNRMPENEWMNAIGILELISKESVYAALHMQPRGFVNLRDPNMEASNRHTSSLKASLSLIVSNPNMYCNIITPQCLNSLSSSREHTVIFERMMEDYRKRVGAVVILPYDNFATGITEDSRRLAQQWYRDENSWFYVLPIFLSIQLGGLTALEVSMELFKAVQSIGHKRVMLITGNLEETEVAKNAKLQPTVPFSALMKKLKT